MPQRVPKVHPPSRKSLVRKILIGQRKKWSYLCRMPLHQDRHALLEGCSQLEIFLVCLQKRREAGLQSFIVFYIADKTRTSSTRIE
jgi:hypothetical protein